MAQFKSKFSAQPERRAALRHSRCLAAQLMPEVVSMTNIQALHEQMNQAGLPNEIWQNAGKNRIYFTKLPSDITAYIEFDQVYSSAMSDAWKEYQNYWIMCPYDDVFRGCKLYVFTNVFAQPAKSMWCNPA